MANETQLKWNRARLDLTKALDDWQNLSASGNIVSPDEKMLSDIQRLLIEIKLKLTSFESENDKLEAPNDKTNSNHF